MKKFRMLAWLIGCVLAVGGNAWSATVVIQISNFAFSPASVTIAVGDTVRWINNDSVAHTSTSGQPGAPDSVWDSDFLATGESFEFTFNASGSFAYFCRVHPFMTALVQVAASSATVVQITNMAFSPTSVTIAVGDTVRWINSDSVIHFAISGQPGVPDYVWNSGALATGASFDFTFNAPGSFAYFCQVHLSMTGLVQVATGSVAVAGSLSASPSTLNPGQQTTLAVEVTSFSSESYDVYLIAEAPWGQFYSLNGNRQFVGPNLFTTLVAGWIATTVPVTPLVSITNSGLPAGDYIFHLIMVRANASLDDTSRWQSQSAKKITLL